MYNFETSELQPCYIEYEILQLDAFVSVVILSYLPRSGAHSLRCICNERTCCLFRPTVPR